MPESHSVSRHAALASVVGAVHFATGSDLESAATIAVGVFVLWTLYDLAELRIGDYAGNVLFGVVVLAFVGSVTATSAVWLPFLLGGTAVGGWLLLDGVQHLRHGIGRDGTVRGIPAESDDGIGRSLPRLFVGRLLEPFRVG